jgi:predicted NAD/FAD-binding protein
MCAAIGGRRLPTATSAEISRATPHGVVVHDSHGWANTYDFVVIASHSDQALKMLSDADDREPAVLGAIGYAPNNEADHGARDGSSLRRYAQRRAAEHGIDLTGGRVLLLGYPRLLGYTFNPLSVYFGYRADGPLLAATFNGRHRALTSSALLRSFFSLPLVTLKIVAAIHWEALRLWFKGARLVPRPGAAPANTANTAFNTVLATGKCNDYTGVALSAVGREPEPREALWSSEGRI